MQEEDNATSENNNDSYAPLANVYNIVVLIALAFVAYSAQSDSAPYAILAIGGAFALINLVCMITFMIKGYSRSWPAFLVWVIVVPAATGVCWLISILPRGKIGG